MFLTTAELRDLTDRQHADAQIAWLRARGWPFEVSAEGRPKVARAEWEARMLSRQPVARKPASPRLGLVR